jgi:hypothetical protein
VEQSPPARQRRAQALREIRLRPAPHHAEPGSLALASAPRQRRHRLAPGSPPPRLPAQPAQPLAAAAAAAATPPVHSCQRNRHQRRLDPRRRESTSAPPSPDRSRPKGPRYAACLPSRRRSSSASLARQAHDRRDSSLEMPSHAVWGRESGASRTALFCIRPERAGHGLRRPGSRSSARSRSSRPGCRGSPRRAYASSSHSL